MAESGSSSGVFIESDSGSGAFSELSSDSGAFVELDSESESGAFVESGSMTTGTPSGVTATTAFGWMRCQHQTANNLISLARMMINAIHSQRMACLRNMTPNDDKSLQFAS